MTDRLKGLTVVFENDIREDDAEQIINAIAQIRGVLSISPVLATGDDYFAYQKAKRELTDKLYEALK